MPSLSESLLDGQALPIHDALVAGVDTLSGNQTVSFTPYVRTVLPVDGFVFWLNANLLSPVQLAQQGLASADPVVIDGSLHYASQGSQASDETIVIRSVTFTAEEEIEAFAELAPRIIFVAEWQTPLGPFKFTFSARNSFYRQAKLFHYVGDAIYPVFERALIDEVGQFDQRQVVSNSLPVWLAMVQAVPFPSLVTTDLELFPAFLIPDNLTTPYGAIEIPPATTRPLQAVPFRSRDSSHGQLAAERVKITMYGLRNDEVMDFYDYAMDYIENTGNLGLMNSPIVRDEPRIQLELTALAQKKSIEFEVSYNQVRTRDIARQLISNVAFAGFFPSDHVIPNDGNQHIVPAP